MEQSKDDVISALTKRVEEMERRIAPSKPTQPDLYVWLPLDEFRAKKRKEGVPMSKPGQPCTVYASITSEKTKYFEEVLNTIAATTGFKFHSADLFRAVIDEFTKGFTVDQAIELMNKGKTKFIVR